MTSPTATYATVTLDAKGRGAVTIDGAPQPLAGPDLATSREQARLRVVEHAQRIGGPVRFTVTEPAGTRDLVAGPDGNVTPAPAEAQPVITTPAWEQSAPIAAQPPTEELDPELAEEERRPAATSWRGGLNKLGMSLGPGAAELEARREQIRARRAREQEQHAQETRAERRRREAAEAERAERGLIQTNYLGTRTILVANPKGGSRKTTSTWMLGHTMGTIRGGAVVAWDANETMGTLSDRGMQDRHSSTVVDLIEQAAPAFGSVEGIRLGALDAYVRPQGDSHFDLLASDEDPTRQDIVGADNFRAVHEILSRFYRLILLDTGNNIRAAHFTEALDHTDQLVIPVAAGRDSAAVAQKMMRSLVATGHRDLVRGAVVLLHDLEPAESADPGYLHVAQDIAADLAPQVSAVVPVPFDPALKEGARIDPTALSDATRAAYRKAAAAVAQTLREATDR
ncbi:hypothetical protein [uncultured Brachybacterium sp.]|uniref:MinD/ParA family ATP-binding protein n=1 Tax=uncultured Brachybacterium sp. TaxID=189680 RepID=UPI0026336F51|nr:hypothetical protein [uncultured Brachybacterium sp.]